MDAIKDPDAIQTKRFVGFYAHQPFWAGCEPSREEAVDDFEKVMSDIVIARSTARYDLRVSRDGLVMLHMNDIADEISSYNEISWLWQVHHVWPRYLAHLNALNLLIETAYFTHANAYGYDLQQIKMRDAITAQLWDDGFALSLDSRDHWTAELCRERQAGPPEPSEDWRLDPRFLKRHIKVTREAFDDVFCWFDRILQDSRSVRELALLVKSADEYKQIDYVASMMTSWFVIESFVRTKHSELFREQLGPGEAKHRSIANLIDMLASAGEIDPAMKREIHELRNHRNEFIHGDALWCEDSISRQSFDLAKHLVELQIGFEVHPGLSHRVRCP